jgi:hypothetical protein
MRLYILETFFLVFLDPLHGCRGRRGRRERNSDAIDLGYCDHRAIALLLACFEVRLHLHRALSILETFFLVFLDPLHGCRGRRGRRGVNSDAIELGYCDRRCIGLRNLLACFEVRLHLHRALSLTHRGMSSHPTMLLPRRNLPNCSGSPRQLTHLTD